MILALTDWFYGVVLVNIVWVGFVMTFIYRLILWSYGAYQMNDLGTALFLSVIFYGFFWLLWKVTKGRGMADGDMYVAMYMGILIGFPKGLVAMMLSFVIGAMAGVLLIATKIRSRKDTVPFVPFMIVAMVISLLWGNWIIGYVG